MITKFGLGIRDWNDLDDVRNNLGGHHILMNDLDSTTAGYEELASPTANGEKAGSRKGGQLFFTTRLPRPDKSGLAMTKGEVTL